MDTTSPVFQRRIYTSSPDFAAAACKTCARLFQEQQTSLPAWSEPHFGAEDMKAAYRQPNDPAERQAFIVALFDEVAGAVRYALLRTPFGLAAAVLNFNRVPAFLMR